MKQLYLRGLLVVTTLLLLATASFAQVVISQVYGGAGCTTANCSEYKNDFIELFNPTGAPVSLDGWSVQYASAGGTSWNTTPLSGTIQPGQYYLVSGGGNANGTNSLPASDKAGGLNLSASAGKVALVKSTSALSGSPCPDPTNIADIVAYGSSATCYEGTGPAPTFGGNAKSIFRASNGCLDNNDNATDFISGPVSPRNSASPLNPCGLSGVSITTSSPLAAGKVGESYTATFAASGGIAPYSFSVAAGSLPAGLSLSATGTLSGTPTAGGLFSFTLQAVDNAGKEATKDFELTIAIAATIAQIQGAGIASPVTGYAVSTTGIVTGVKSNGFFIQMPGTGDDDPATSDGLFVFTSSKPPAAVAVGNLVQVSGSVAEYRSSSDPTSPTLTEITAPSVGLLSTGNVLPAPVTLTAADATPTGGVYQLEKYEGMRVQVASLTVVAPTGGFKSEKNATASSNGFFYGVITGTERPFREPGIQEPGPLPTGAPTNVPRWDANPELMGVASRGLTGGNAIDVAPRDVVTNIAGPLDYSNRYYTINVDPASTPGVTNMNRTATPLPLPAADEFTVASFNLERFYDATDDPGGDVALTAAAYANRLNKLSLGVRTILNCPDILGVVEVENLAVLQTIAAKINSDAVAAGHPSPGYVAYLEEGNDIGGIDVGFLVKGGKVNVLSVTQYGKDTKYTTPSGGESILNDRPPLVLRATVNNPACRTPFPITVVVNHLRSLIDIEDPTEGPRVWAKRKAQAEFLAHLIQDLQTEASQAHVVTVGDYNAFQFSDGYVDVMGIISGKPAPADQVMAYAPALTSPALTNLAETLPAAERYSFSFSGSAQVLDHVLVNENLRQRVSRFHVARLNADYPEVYRSDATRPERLSDHDAPVAYIQFPQDTEAPVIASAAASVPTLAPVNHKLHEVTVSYQVTDNCDSEVSATLSVTSNEPANGPGDGNTEADWEVVDGHTVRLRAERSGTGEGRTYTITITATDDAGNTSTKEVVVTVAHDASLVQGNRSAATRELAQASGSLLLKVLPNPSYDRFTLLSQGGSAQPLSIRVTDVMGRVVESYNGVAANGTLRLGANYRPGIYLVEVVQGDVRQTIRLIKQAK